MTSVVIYYTKRVSLEKKYWKFNKNNELNAPTRVEHDTIKYLLKYLIILRVFFSVYQIFEWT